MATKRPRTPDAAIVTGTLLLSDAWFDAALFWGTSGEAASPDLALIVELPLHGAAALRAAQTRAARRRRASG